MRKQVEKRPHLDGKVKLGAFAYHETVKVGDIFKEISTKRKYFLTPPSRSQNNLASPHIFPDPLPPHPRDDQFSPVILDVETERSWESQQILSRESFCSPPAHPPSVYFFLFLLSRWLPRSMCLLAFVKKRLLCGLNFAPINC